MQGNQSSPGGGQGGGGQYTMTDSHDNIDGNSADYSNSNDGDGGGGGGPAGLSTSAMGGKKGMFRGDRGSGGIRINLNFKTKLFLFAFDLIDVNSIYGYVIYSILMIVEMIFLLYYPLNQIYADYVVPFIPPNSKGTYTLQSMMNSTGVEATASNSTPSYVDPGTLFSTLSSSYESLKPTGLYGEHVKYDKRFEGENRDLQVTQALSYISIDYFLDNMGFEQFMTIQSYFCHVMIVFYLLFVAMILTRQIGTINLSGQRRFITKFFSFMLITFAKTLQIPLITFMLKIFSCSNQQIYFDRLKDEITSIEAKAASQAASSSLNSQSGSSGYSGNSQNTGVYLLSTTYQEYCYTGSHLNQVIYMSIVIVLYYSLVAFHHYFLTLSYPHEKLVWASLPTRVPILKEIAKFLIVFSYQEINLASNALSYMNILFTLLWLLILYQRINYALLFLEEVYKETIINESQYLVVFGIAALRDFIPIDRNFILHIIILGAMVCTSMTAILLRKRVRQKSLSKVDFAVYEKDFEALIMMFTLQELIEQSGYDEEQDFLLRGFIERHIEICEFPSCQCINYYQISGQNHRLELAQMSPFSRAFDSNQINSNANLMGMNTRGASTSMVTHQVTSTLAGGGNREQSDGDELSTIKNLFGNNQKNRIKQNKKKSKFLKQFLIDNINVFLDIFPGSVKLHIMAAFIYFRVFKNSFRSLYELSFTLSKKSSLQDKYECSVLSSQVIQYFQEKANKGMSTQPMQFEKASGGKDDKKNKKMGEFNSASFEVESEIKSVIEFEKINIQFQKQIETTSILTRKFWQEILKKNIDVVKVFNLGQRIYKNFVQIKRQYKHLMKLNNYYLEVAYLYKLFVSLILNFEIEVEDAKLEIIKIMQSKSMKKHNLKTEYKTIQLLDENGMIIISGQTANLGRILAMNNKAERTFGYGTNELMGQKLQRLMPRLFMERHEDLVLNFINGNRRINKENHQFVWGKGKNKFLIPLIMEINAYVNFEFGFCFIAFLKRSVLLEFKPMRDLYDSLDVFVMQVNQNGVIQDMTQNMQDILGFPLAALQKDIPIEEFFKDLFDDEHEVSYQNGRKVEFDPAQVKRILEAQDIDGRGDGMDDEGAMGNNFVMSEKKCVACVWLKNFDHTEQDVKLTYREIWFFLTDDETSMFETRNTTEAGTHGLEENKGANVTYTDEREDICSIASMSSLANYDKNRKNIMAKLSEIKTQTIDDQKPRQIDLLQKAIILVFLAVISIALLLLVVSTSRNTDFFSNLDIIYQSKEAAIYFAETRLMLSTLVHFKNARQNSSDPLLSTFVEEMLTSAREEIEDLRKIQSYLNFVEFSYSSTTLSKKKSLIYDYMQIRSNKIIESLSGDISMIQGIQEFLDVSNDITAVQFQSGVNSYQDFVFNTTILNYDNTNSSTFQGQQITQTAINFYQLLKNGHGSLGNYLIQMSEQYNSDAIYQANNNSSLVLILTIISITITMLTAFIILPILHKIERSKEKVLMIYTELKKEQIESLNRNIRIFFMKLQTGAQQVSGSLSYQTSTKQFSNKIMTRKFTMNASAKRGGGPGGQTDDYGFLGRPSSIAQIDMSGGNEMLLLDSGFSPKQKGNKIKDGNNRESGFSNVDPFAALYPKDSPKSNYKAKNSKKVSIFREVDSNGGSKSKRGSKKDLKRGSRRPEDASEDDESDGEEEEEEKKRPKRGRKKSENEEDDEDSDEDLSENAEEDKKSSMLLNKEEAENALFKRIFQNKIKQMTCVRQVKYYSMVTIISLIMCGYFTLSYFMVTQIFKDSQQSLEIFKVVGNRGPYLDTLLSFFIQSQLRNKETWVESLDDNLDGLNQYPQMFNSIDYFFNLTQSNENSYANLRRSTPGIISGSGSLIDGLESQQMCNWLIDDDYVKEYNNRLDNSTTKQSLLSGTSLKSMTKVELIDQCNGYANKLLQLGLQQTINTILQAVLQGTLQFRDSYGGLLQRDRQQQLFTIILVKIRYLNRIDRVLLNSVKTSIVSYFQSQQSNYVVVFSVFLSIVVIAMIVLSYYGVEYLFKNLIAVKFILNFIPGQWLIENNAAEDLKYVEF